ncbi:beta-galactosidase trimerization domain-containing protein [Rhizobium sp. DKSPLA3]|uniref:Beta-galactosidase trimerization domain-containing protein n=1 Tax=Rhizobium quercicola TaxID=2901226 RepID=A0A9X1NPV3_9HYPH|nr:beta-galactosidase trimerization domain-containing protein [Rhizobium quercicola]MCD7107836.1 beta-galactosidase trimerization domain-containing protein [Rhizobium quercicola]
MRFRQIHLDFHTSPLIDGVGSRFDAATFASTYRAAHVDSVTLFSKCHHGLSYHPTDVGRMHPGLGFDLLRGQIDALHSVGIRAPVYLSAAWDEHAAQTHPEWRIVSPDGTLPQSRNEPTGWAFLDFSTPYLDYLCRQVDEVMRTYGDGDGIFLDISFQMPTVSTAARAKMDALGLDWTRPADRETFLDRSTEAYYEAVKAAVRRHDPVMPLFFNSGHVRRGQRAHYRRYYSHLELESLPTAGWGYDHFPLSARYVDPIGFDFLGMTGKFHFTWGEVGGYKRPEALVYECGAMLAHGARCSIGDHLHPTGALDPSTMAIIAPAYRYVDECEPWCLGSINRADIGLLSLQSVETPAAGGGSDRDSVADDGASRILLEAGLTFDVLDLDSDFSPYRLLILPDAVPVDDALRVRIEHYAASGGKVLLTGRSGIDPERGFVFDLGARWHGTSPMTGGDYLLPIAPLQADGIDQPMFMYQPSERITVTDGLSLGAVHEPYFDRTPRHFSGHIHAPSRPEASAYQAGVQKGNFVYLAHPVFSIYHQVGAVRMLEMAERAIAFALGGTKLISTSLPRAGRVTVRSQPEQGRDVIHLLHATPALRGQLWEANIQPIQDITPLFDIAVSLKTAGPVHAIRSVPSGDDLPFIEGDGIVGFTLPRMAGHAMIEVSYRR